MRLTKYEIFLIIKSNGFSPVRVRETDSFFRFDKVKSIR